VTDISLLVKPQLKKKKKSQKAGTFIFYPNYVNGGKQFFPSIHPEQ